MSVRHRITSDSALYLAGELIEAAANTPSTDYAAYGSFEDTLALVDATGAAIVPLPGYVATLRPGEGRFGGAVAVEEGTTNHVPGNIQAWSDYASQASTYSIVPVSTPYGPGVQLAGQSAGRVGKHTSGDINLGTSYATTSIYFKPNVASGILTFYWDARDDAGVWRYGTFSDKAINLSAYAPGQWYRLVCTVSIAPNTFAGGTGFYVWAEGTFDVEIAAPQLEAKPFATSFVDGTRAGGKLEYPASMLNARQGTVSVWVWPTLLYDYNCVIHSAIGDAGGDTTNRFFIHLFQNGSISYEVAGYGVRVVAPPGTIAAQKWVHLAMTWESGILKGYYNGLLVGTVSVSSDATIGSVLRLGHSEPGGYFNGLIDELLILPYAASEEEVHSLYQTTVARFHANGDVSIKGELVEGDTGFRYGSDGNLHVNELVEGVNF